MRQALHALEGVTPGEVRSLEPIRVMGLTWGYWAAFWQLWRDVVSTRQALRTLQVVTAPSEVCASRMDWTWVHGLASNPAG